jgi:hypothetical protein
MSGIRTGACLRGAVTDRVEGPLRSVTLCHCGQCRRMAGPARGAAVPPRAAIAVSGPLTWYRSSPQAARGVCPRCGSSLFWRADGEEGQSVALGSLDEPTGLTLEAHIFAGDTGDYYQIADGLPIREG